MGLKSFTDKLAEQDERYFIRVKSRGRTPNVFNDPRIAARVFLRSEGWDRGMHEDRAHVRMDQAARAKRQYDEALSDAVRRYGDLKPGVRAVSGIYNPDFPEDVKDKLRSLKDWHVYQDAALVHWRAAGKRSAPPPLQEGIYPVEHTGKRRYKEPAVFPNLPPGTSRG